MSKKVKLTWNFSGNDSKKIADHFLIHLNEYIKHNDIIFFDMSVHILNEFSSTAYIIINQENLIKIRDDLRPHQAFIVR